MAEAITARQRAADRKAAVLEGITISDGMPSGPAQVYVGVLPPLPGVAGGPARYFLYRSPDGRRKLPIEGTYKTPKLALAAREREMA